MEIYYKVKPLFISQYCTELKLIKNCPLCNEKLQIGEKIRNKIIDNLKCIDKELINNIYTDNIMSRDSDTRNFTYKKKYIYCNKCSKCEICNRELEYTKVISTKIHKRCNICDKFI